MNSMNNEDVWEGITLERLGEEGWEPKHGKDIAPGTGERDSWDELVIKPRLLAALRRLNPGVPDQYLQQALAEIIAPKSQDAIAENYRVHRMFTEGYRLSYYDADGTEHNPTLRLMGMEETDNQWLAVNQVRLVQGEYERRFDVVLYCNGMPVSIIELKKAGAVSATVATAHAQLQTYLREFPLAFRFCMFTLASDGLDARYGTPFTPLNHFSPWKVDDDGVPVETGHDLSGEAPLPLETALSGLYNPSRFLQLLFWYTAFDGGEELQKRIAKPHQYFAVAKAVGSTITAVKSTGKAGVVWHTQGSGKSMEMELYANRVMRHAQLKNPTIVVITDRNELDGQLFAGFERSLLLPDTPMQIQRRSDLRAELSNRVTGGIYFTTLQKFGKTKRERETGQSHPLLSDRKNIIVMVDEAHRSHYDDLDGYARHLRDALPGATLIAFTGTPISFEDRNTRDVFGDYIDVYDLSRAVDDGATVPVYFEPRLIKVQRSEELSEEDIDNAADEATVGLDDTERVKIEQSVAVVNAVYGAPERIEMLAKEIVDHWEERRATMSGFIAEPEGKPTYGKAMIVGGTREICANLYAAVVRLRPDWHSDELTAGKIKVVYSGDATDVPPVSTHVRRDSLNNIVKARVKNPEDELELVIVKDMMLTGFDAPALHTLYLDRPLKGALLMQTLARVNRTFRGKQDGLLVAFAPLADNLAAALQEYSSTDQKRKPVGRNVEELAVLTKQLIAQIEKMLAGIDWRLLRSGPSARSWLGAVHSTVNYLRDPLTPGNQPAEGEASLAATYRVASSALARAWSLCSASGAVDELRADVQFFEEVRVWMAKFDAQERRANGRPIPSEIQTLLGNLIARSTDATGEVLDIYEAAGMPKPSLGQLTPEFVAKAKKAKNQHLAIEALRKLVAEESIKVTAHNMIRQRAFSQRITELMRKYTNQQLTSAEIIAELLEMADEITDEASRGERFEPPLDYKELAFYDAISQNESAVDLQGPGILAEIARQLVAMMKRDAKTDWTVREDVRAKLRSQVKRLLVINGYPPDQQPEAIKLVIEQMETMALRENAAARVH
ncbi:DEAD/DEAH box helicase [Arthrobacter sp. MYb224]|nr:DEAD/DEAH box helicase [Arthrobacter sp. MYb224]